MSTSRKDSKKKEEAQDVNYVEHLWSWEEVEKEFGTSITSGLSDEQVLKNREKYGKNELTPPPKTPEWLKFLYEFTNFFSLLLLGGGILCFIGYGIDPDKDQTNLYLGVVLILVVLITATFSYMQEAKSAKIMEGFAKLIPKDCKVTRNGVKSKIDPSELVPGDLVDVSDGDQIPADIRVLKATELKVDNSSLTGESEAQERTPENVNDEGEQIKVALEAKNLIFYTTTVSQGSGVGIVIGTGDTTAMGQIATMTQEQEADDTPIKKEIKKFILLISAIAITLGIIFLAIGFAIGTEPIKNVVFMIGIIVANVPEGLLATVTVSLALTAKRMFKKNVLVKKLEAVETLGSTTVICSDKTGTLTQNRMTVLHCWYDHQIRNTPPAKNLPDLRQQLAADENAYDINSPSFIKLHRIASLCNNSKFIFADEKDDSGNIVLSAKAQQDNFASSLEEPTFNVLGMDMTSDASEQGLMKMAQLVKDRETYHAEYPELIQIKFNSTNKWQLSVHKQPDKPYPLLVMKGAAERVFARSTSFLENGEAVPVTPQHKEAFEKAYEDLGGLGERVLGFAYKELTDFTNDFEFSLTPQPNFPTDDLTFAGLFSLIDPPREGVPQAVAKCKRARIRVFMVTGDHKTTAQAIAKQVGIFDQSVLDAGKAKVVVGDDIRDLMNIEDEAERDRQWLEILSYEQLVFARVSPKHKLYIVDHNRRLRGEVVAVTGDGVNDAPALKKADIGIAMGIAGKDVSKAVADMILMDDNFASIVNGVEEGRLIFDNLKKSIAYTLTSNIPEIAPFLCFIVLRIPLPLSTVLILCVDLGTDMVPAISMAYEEKESDIMDRPPRRAETDRLVNRRLISFAYFQIGVIQALAGFFTYMVVLNDYGYPPRELIGLGLEWEEWSLMCSSDDRNRPGSCGYGCGSPKFDNDFYDQDIFQGDDNFSKYCEDGCRAPCVLGEGECTEEVFVASADPFSEFDEDGYRGGDFCDLTCENYCEKVYTGSDVQDCIDADDNLPNDFLPAACTEGRETQSVGFFDRGEIKPQAPKGARYWWDGTAQDAPNQQYQQAALEYAQTSYFISIIVVQWADLLISKCRKLSLFNQGMRNSFMNFGLAFETVLGALLIYTPPLNTVFGTRPLHILHWFPGVPWSILIFVYDETRKSLMRANPGGWVEQYTYW
mmetsp:Transcript_503/g.1740  ORF Transcript_503/g.1740 Transcript_503/m.1740 type:complete len:1169 (+) Transcript_503:286-3792(+)